MKQQYLSNLPLSILRLSQILHLRARGFYTNDRKSILSMLIKITEKKKQTLIPKNRCRSSFLLSIDGIRNSEMIAFWQSMALSILEYTTSYLKVFCNNWILPQSLLQQLNLHIKSVHTNEWQFLISTQLVLVPTRLDIFIKIIFFAPSPSVVIHSYKDVNFFPILSQSCEIHRVCGFYILSIRQKVR